MSMPTYLGMPAFPEAAAVALQDSQLRRNLAHATGAIRVKRAAAVAELADWPELRVRFFPNGTKRLTISSAQ